MPDTDQTNRALDVAKIAGRAAQLYSRPGVALEIVRLTELPHVDTDALRQCIERDPALTSKILRVVNSSLFGLTQRVGDLNQAVALLGIKPLKLLVLGFSLPDALFAEVAARELRWYWTGTLTKAAAARLLLEKLWRRSGDEAFIAGLLDDIGALVMLREIGRPYAKFLSGVIDERCHLGSLERKTLGFDHVELTAALLTRWQLPRQLIDAVAAPRNVDWLVRAPSPEGDLAQALHLADLLSQLVGGRRLRALPELLAAGRAYRQLTMGQLAELVRQLQPQVDQLADALALELDKDRDYSATLRDAHEQMGVLTEEVVAETNGAHADDDAHLRLNSETSELSDAMRTFLKTGRAVGGERPTSPSFGCSSALSRKLASAASQCRQRRQELSLMLFDAYPTAKVSAAEADDLRRRMSRALDRACVQFDRENVSLIWLGERGAAAVLSDCDRSAALGAAHRAIRDLDLTPAPSQGVGTALDVAACAGVATMHVVPKNFEPAKLIEPAERCLSAARACGISTAKSIEV